VKTLVFWGGGSPDLARRHQREGAIFLLWGGERRALDSLSLPFLTADLTPAQAEGVERAALRWGRAWPRIPLLDGRSFRELLEWKGVCLADLLDDFAQTSPRSWDYVRLLETLDLLLEKEAPDEVVSVGLPQDAALLLRRAATRRGILYHGPERGPGRAGILSLLRGRVGGLGRLRSSLRASLSGPPPRRAPPAKGLPVLFVLSGADEEDLARAARGDPGLSPLFLSLKGRSLGPCLEDYSGGDLPREVKRASRHLREIWSRLRTSPALGDAFSHRGVSFADLALPDLEELLLSWLPRAIRSFEQGAAALLATRPAVVCLGPSSGPLLLACRAAGVPALERQGGESAESLLARLRASTPAEGAW
jgi:hypothetical protein